MATPAEGPSKPSLSRQLTSHLDQFVEHLADLRREDEAAAAQVAQLGTGVATDIGGGAVNQDKADVFEAPGGCLVMAVYDELEAGKYVGRAVIDLQ